MIKATIKCNVYGDYYIDLEAETTAEKLLLTSVRKQERERGQGFMNQGGGSGPVDEAGIDMNLDYLLTIKVNKETRTSTPDKKKRKFFS